MALTFSGQVSGAAVTATSLSPPVCGKRADGSFAAAFLTAVGASTFQVSIAVAKGYAGPGSYTGEQGFHDALSFVVRDVASTSAYGNVENGSIHVAVNADERSGTVDGDYDVFEGAATAIGHLAGSWRCAA